MMTYASKPTQMVSKMSDSDYSSLDGC